MERLKDLKAFLKYVDPLVLHEKIGIFRDLPFKKMTYEDLKREILKVISFDTPSGKRSVLMPASSVYPAGTRFYRVRKISEGDRQLPLRSMSKISDCWEPPESICRLGRLNRDNEALLYTTPSLPAVAVEEMKIPDGELFSLIVYESIENINVTMIGFPPKIEGLSSEELLKLRVFQDFLKHEFIRDVGVGTEYLYRISESIAKDYFDLPPDFQDAWCYPSVAEKGAANVCFRRAKRVMLRLIGVQIASVQRQCDSVNFGVKLIATDSGDGENLSYHKVGSEVALKLFPEILIAK